MHNSDRVVSISKGYCFVYFIRMWFWLILDEAFRICYFYLGVVLGRDGGVIQNMYWPFFFGVGGKIGSGRQPFPWVHVADIARLFVFAVETDQVKGVLNGVAPQLITNEQFAKALGTAMSRPAVLPLPEIAVNLAFGEERGKIMLEGQKVIPKRTLDAGFTFKYPTIEVACKQCVSSSEVLKLDL